MRRVTEELCYPILRHCILGGYTGRSGWLKKAINQRPKRFSSLKKKTTTASETKSSGPPELTCIQTLIVGILLPEEGGFSYGNTISRPVRRHGGCDRSRKREQKIVMSGAHDGNLNKKAETLLGYNVSEHKELRETHSLRVKNKLFAVVAPCLAPEGHRVIDGAKASAIF